MLPHVEIRPIPSGRLHQHEWRYALQNVAAGREAKFPPNNSIRTAYSFFLKFVKFCDWPGPRNSATAGV